VILKGRGLLTGGDLENALYEYNFYHEDELQ